MKRLILFGAVLFSLVPICSAATCVSGSLASYLSLGSGGCMIGGDTLSNFQILSGQTGATAIAASSLGIMATGGFNPTLTFSTNQTASTGSLLESIFTYDISGPSFTGSSITLANSSETVDGAVTDIENFCAGGMFGPDGVSGCTGSTGSLLTLDGIQNQNQSPLGPATFLQVTNDFTVNGGTAGSASGGLFTNSFTATPEPGTLLLGGLGLVFAMVVRRRKKSNIQQHSGREL